MRRKKQGDAASQSCLIRRFALELSTYYKDEPMTHQSTPAPEPTTTGGVPLSLRPCFQEYEFEQLDPTQHAALIIERTLAYGNRREVGWLFAYYGRVALVKWVQHWGARRLPWRRYNLWCVLLDLPPARRLRPEGSRIWPY